MDRCYSMYLQLVIDFNNFNLVKSLLDRKSGDCAREHAPQRANYASLARVVVVRITAPCALEA